MGTKERTALTEAMFYVLMAFLHGDMCGTEITEFVQSRTKERVILGPGTLYALLSKFQEEKLIREVAVSGRKRTYQITDKGRAAYHDELARLHACLNDAQEEKAMVGSKGRDISLYPV